VEVTYSSSATLKPEHIPVTTNADEEQNQTVPLLYRLTAPFTHGQLERLKTNGAWQKTSEFTRSNSDICNF
jgi:hypothetical protein